MVKMNQLKVLKEKAFVKGIDVMTVHKLLRKVDFEKVELVSLAVCVTSRTSIKSGKSKRKAKFKRQFV
jgi:hypothetical protein